MGAFVPSISFRRIRMLKSKSIILIIFVVFIGSFFSIQAQAKTTEKNGKTRLFQVNGLMVSANINSLELGEVVKDFSKATGIKVQISEARYKKKVTIEFKDSPLDVAAKAIIGSNYSLIYGSGTSEEVFKEFGKRSFLYEIEIFNSLKWRSLKHKEKPDEFTFNPNILAKRILEYGDAPGRIAMMERVQREGIELDLDVLKKILRNDKNLRVQQLVLEEIINKLKSKEGEDFLLKIGSEDANPELKKFAESLLRSVREENAWMYKK